MTASADIDEIKDSVLTELGWSPVALCLTLCSRLEPQGIIIFHWVFDTNKNHAHMYHDSHPDFVMTMLKPLLLGYGLALDDWEWKRRGQTTLRNYHPNRSVRSMENYTSWESTLTMRQNPREDWLQREPPPGGKKMRFGWSYYPYGE